MKEIRIFKAGESIPTDAKFLFFFPTDQAYHYEVPMKKEKKMVTAELRVMAGRVITYLNQITGSKYSDESKAVERLIQARMNDGRTFEDFKKVIDKKFIDWGHDPLWMKYLRPETLFGGKFDSYLGGVADESDAFQELDKELERIK